MKKWRSLEERKKALELYYNEGKTQKEVAESIKISVNTIKSWIRRSRLKNFNMPDSVKKTGKEIRRAYSFYGGRHGHPGGASCAVRRVDTHTDEGEDSQSERLGGCGYPNL